MTLAFVVQGALCPSVVVFGCNGAVSTSGWRNQSPLASAPPVEQGPHSGALFLMLLGAVQAITEITEPRNDIFAVV